MTVAQLIKSFTQIVIASVAKQSRSEGGWIAASPRIESGAPRKDEFGVAA